MYEVEPFSIEDASSHLTIDGWRVVSYAQVVARLMARHPERSPQEIEAVLDREADAFTGGRVLVLPLGVEEGAAEVLGRPMR